MKSHGRHDKKCIAWYDRGPGPAGYSLPPLVGRKDHAITHLINPEYTMRPKFPYLLKNFGPGAGAYLIPVGLKARGWDKPPAYTMRPKIYCGLKGMGPGPANYKMVDSNVWRYRTPAFTIKGRTPLLRKFQTPAPNCYLVPPALGPKIPDKIAGPACSLKGHRDGPQKEYIPTGDYTVGCCELIKRKPPGFSIGRRYNLKYKGCPNVGPASYEPKFSKIRPCAPAWHMAIRYNDFTGIYKTECDSKLPLVD